jgi:type IV pilus assembly protein PilB
LPFVDPEKFRFKQSLVERIGVEQVQQNEVLPVAVKNGTLFVAIDDPARAFVADNIAFIAGCEVRCALMPPTALKAAMRKFAPVTTGSVSTAVPTSDEDVPIIRLVEKTVAEALAARASDIHVEPFADRIRIRYRIDGVLREKASLDRALQGPLTSRLKIMAAMDIAEKRKPQDGRIDFRSAGREIDIRTSVLPGNHGETIVMRLLDKEDSLRDLPGLGLAGADHDRFSRIIKRPNGIFLVTGPTGSGKTTTLYAALKTLNRSDVKIITAEDPVEFNIAGINQCQVRPAIGLSFARILRAMLRQAPNIILVGEIRDLETAEIAVQAALTGHLVFSTLHTNDAPSAITRLIDIGVKPFLVSASVQAVMAQRLMRVLCEKCREPYAPSAVELGAIGLDADKVGSVQLFRATGCEACDHSGYHGRRGIFELMEMDSTLREMTFRSQSTVRIRDYARTSGGMSTLTEDGQRKVLDGTTSADELLRVTAAVE